MADSLEPQVKINTLKTLIANEELNVFQQQLFVDAAESTTGNEVADEGLKAQATNAQAIIAACSRRIETYKKKLAEITAA